MPIHSEKYDPLVIPAPVSGMNMNIDDESLPSSYAFSLSGFIPDPVGSLLSRNGTIVLEKYEGLETLYAIPYTQKDGSEGHFVVCRNDDDPDQSDLWLVGKKLMTFPRMSRMRGFSCMGKLLFANGVDPIQVFNEDTQTLSPLEQRVTLKLKKTGDFFSVNGQNYQSIHLNRNVYVLKNGSRYDITDKMIDKFKLNPSPVGGDGFEFVVYPPRSAFCSVFGGIFWTLGEGVTSRNFKSKDQAMMAYRSFNPNRLDSFLNPQTGLMPFIELTHITNIDDSLERIDQYLNFLVFFGKKQIYVYNGIYPESPDFSYQYCITTGLYHPDLVQSVGNDIIFTGEGGHKRLSRLARQSTQSSTINISQGKDVSVSDINGLDPLVRDFQRLIDDELYLYCSSAFCEQTRQVMFKIGLTETMVFSVMNEQYIPYLYSGDFTQSYALAEGRDCVYLAYRDSVLCYQERKESAKDLCGNISFLWRSPTIDFGVKTFTSQHIVVNMECDPKFSKALKKGESNLELEVCGIKGRSFHFSKSLRLSSGGDMMHGLSVVGKDNYGGMTKISFKQPLSLEFSKANFRVTGESSRGRIRIKNISLNGIFSHGN